MSTSRQIKDVSLDLMSVHGFDGVSIRDICKVVGIKESTVYYHFKNKDAILESIVNDFIKFNESMTVAFENADYRSFNIDIVKIVTMEYVKQYLLDDFIVKFAKLLSIQQNSNEKLKELYITHFFDNPVEFQKQIIKFLIDANIVKYADADFVAASYYSYIFFMYNKYIVSYEISDKAKKNFLECIADYIDKFMDVYGGKL